ncbi:MAG: Ig-like domain-containing protein [Patescibacteria group bacterium]
MKNFIVRFFAAAAILASVAFSVQPALAGGGGLWTDISDKIAERANRPVWAMAYAAPYWFLTDGQELWSGGHVWKTEGSAMADATVDVRNAGLNRVDDIVSDGQTVLFLKNVVNRNNNFEIVAYNGSYSNWTSQIRNLVNSDEGLVSITGKNGIWTIVTTKGRVIYWNKATLATGQFTNQSGSQYLNDMAYSTRHVSPADNYSYIPVAAQPISNGWFVAYRDTNTGYMRFYRQETGGYSTEITGSISQTRYLQFLASNGSSVLLATGDSSATYTDHVYLYDGVSFKAVTNYSGSGPANWNRAIASWDGYHWMVMVNKQHYFVDNTLLYSSDTETDYFITVAGNSSGSYLVGGAVSDSYHGNSPTSPLTLKLVKVDLGTSNWNNGYTSGNGSTNSGSFGGGSTYSSSAGPNVTTAGNPSNYTINNGETFIYRATASDPNGVNRVSLYVDGSLAKTCYSDTCEYSNIYYSNSLSTRNIPVYAVSMDNNGYTTQTANESIKVNGTGSSSNQYGNNSVQNSSSGTYYWSYFDPNQTTLQRGNTMTYNVGANDSDGIKRIELYVNGQLKKTCDLGQAYGNQLCSQTIYGTDYLSGANLAVNARIMDYLNKETWVPVQTIYVSDNGSNNNNNGNDISTWTWLDPSGSTLARTSNTTFRVQASATQGLSLMEVYVNGNLKRTCFGQQNTMATRLYGTQSCDLTIYGTDYSNGSVLSLNARATDYNGKTAWSDNKSLTVQDNGSTSGDISTWTWLDPSNSTLARTSNATFRVQSSASQGLNTMEVYVNGNLKRTCNFSRVYGTQSCDLTIYGTDNSNGSVLSLNSKATDYNGKTAWSDNKSLTIQDNGSNSNTNASVGLQASPNQTTFNNGDQVTFNATAQDYDGLARMEVLVDGTVQKTCYYSNSTNWETCAYTTNLYSNGSSSRTYNASMNAFDRYGNSRGINPISYTVYGNGSSNNNNNYNSNTNPTTWAWSEPNENMTIATNGYATYNVGAWDQEGLKRIDMYVNGSLSRTCNFGSAAYGNQQCSITINGSSYSNGNQLYVNAKAVDAFDREGWSTPRTYTIQGSTSNGGGTNQSGYTWVWATPDVTDVYSNNNVTFNVGANDPDGIRKIEIMGNGKVFKTCDFGLVYGNQQCSIAVATTYPGTTYANYYGRVTDGNYATMNSETKSFKIMNPTQSPADHTGTVSAWSSRDNGYGAKDKITFSASGSDADGVDKIELLVNARLVKTCYGSTTASCSWIGGPYADRSTVTYAARLVDKAGHSYTTGYKTINKK